jgi:hypothetical protein
VKRSVKFLIFLAVLVVVVAAYFIVTKLVERADRLASAGKNEDAEIVLFDDSDTLSKVIWTFAGETHSFTVNAGTWIFAENLSYPFDKTAIDAMADAVKKIKSSRTLENVTDLEQYGLGDGACELSLKSKSGTLNLRIGNINETNKKCYVLIEGDPKVYMVSEALRNAFAKTPLQMVQIEEITKPEEVYGFRIDVGSKSICVESVAVNSAISADGKADMKWVRKVDGRGGSIEEDISADKVAVMQKALENFINNIVWFECTDVDLREKEYSDYGLDSPTCVVEFFYRETANVSSGKFNEDGSAIMETVVYDMSKTFTIGSLEDVYYYATSNDTNRCYLVEQYIVQPILGLETYLFETSEPQE